MKSFANDEHIPGRRMTYEGLVLEVSLFCVRIKMTNVL
jgi:hypothetical protein